jgi:xylulokinase
VTCVVGLDIGTTSTIGILIELPDRVHAIATRPVALRAPHPGWAEEDPEEWWRNCAAILCELCRQAGVPATRIAAIGTTGMLPAVVLLDAAGRLLRPSIQQSDGRCGTEVEELRREVDEAAFLAKAGNGVNQQLVTAKLRWLRRHEPAVFRDIATVFGSYDYVNFRLTGARRIEQNWALEAGFVDVARGALDDSLIALSHLPRAAIPPRALSHEVIGRVSAAAAAETGLAAGTPVVGGAADLVASALAAGIVGPGDCLLKFGGSVDILVAAAEARPDPRLYLDHHLVPGLFMPNGCMATGGSALNWFVTGLGAAEAARGVALGRTAHAHLDLLAADIAPGSEGLTVLPYFLGEKTPIHDPLARGAIEGLTLSHGVGHVWRALLEAYAYALRHHVEVLRELGHRPTRFVASDGGARSRVWMQIVADVLQAPVRLLEGHPGSCLGAAWTAAIGIGATTSWSGIDAFVAPGALLAPQRSSAAVYEAGYARYRELYARLAPLWRPPGDGGKHAP